MAYLPIAINIEILGEIKTFDYDNFRNCLMIVYFAKHDLVGKCDVNHNMQPVPELMQKTFYRLI